MPARVRKELPLPFEFVHYLYVMGLGIRGLDLQPAHSRADNIRQLIWLRATSDRT